MIGKIRLIAMALAVCSISFVGKGWAQDAEAPMLTAAIFVMNRAGEQYDAKLDTLNDMLTTRLAEKGFSVIDHKEVVKQFSEYNERNRAEEKEQDMLVLIKALLGDEKPGGMSLDELVSSYSAKKIAAIVQADYLIMATINSVGVETRSGEAYGQNMGSITTTMRVALKVLEGHLGGTVAGSIVEASNRTPMMEGVTIVDSDLSNKLLEQCAMQAVDQIGSKIERIRDVVVETPLTVTIEVESNIDGADVVIDGIVYGTTPCKIVVPQGPASIKISRQWFQPVERFVNPFEGQRLNVSLEMSAEGVARWKDIEAFKLAMKDEENKQAIAKEQSEADAYAKKKVAEGEKKKRENSAVKDDGLKDALKEIIHGD